MEELEAGVRVFEVVLVAEERVGFEVGEVEVEEIMMGCLRN